MADLMAPGKSYYYIANFHTLELELVSDSVSYYTGEQASQATIQKLLALALPSEIEKIHKKEQVIQSFVTDFITPREILDYKFSYTYKNKNYDGKEHLMLHQATVLSLNDDDQFVHVFSIHSDISHLLLESTDCVCFINLKEGPSYYNVDTSTGKFDLKGLKVNAGLRALFTPREIEIIRKLAVGDSADEIADALHISVHTVRTHRKNLLKKVECKNTTHLLSMCLAEGLFYL